MLNDDGPQQQIEQVVGAVLLGLGLVVGHAAARAREEAVHLMLVEDEEVAAQDERAAALLQ